jgi:hypothetical protein
MCLVALSGCNAGGSMGVNGNPDQLGAIDWKVPGVGSFIIERTFDTANSFIDQTFDTLRFIWRGTRDGKMNVVGYKVFAQQYVSDTCFIAYEDNGDISILLPNSDPTNLRWTRYPTGGHSSIDSIVAVHAPSNQRIVNYEVFTFLGQDSIIIPPGKFTSVKVHDQAFTVTTTTGLSKIDSAFSRADNIWFVPAIGCIGKDNWQLAPWYGFAYDEVTKFELH